MALPEFSMRQLLESGAHFGHRQQRWNPKMAPFIYGQRNDIHILDLTQTVPLLHRALVTLRDVAASGDLFAQEQAFALLEHEQPGRERRRGFLRLAHQYDVELEPIAIRLLGQVAGVVEDRTTDRVRPADQLLLLPGHFHLPQRLLLLQLLLAAQKQSVLFLELGGAHLLKIFFQPFQPPPVV